MRKACAGASRPCTRDIATPGWPAGESEPFRWIAVTEVWQLGERLKAAVLRDVRALYMPDVYPATGVHDE